MHWKILNSDVLTGLAQLPDASIDVCVTSPPYWGLRDYKVAGQLGMEATLSEYLAHMVVIFREIKRVLRPDGNLWLNMGDAYSTGGGGQGDKWKAKGEMTPLNRMVSATGVPAGNLIGQPWRLAFALQDDGWILRQDNIWHKKNPMPESVKSRTTRAHEYVFHFVKRMGYFYNHAALKEPASLGTHLRVSQANILQQPGGPKDSKNGNRSHRMALTSYANRNGYGKTTGPNSRMAVDRDPAHQGDQDTGVGWGYAQREPRYKSSDGVNPKARLINANLENGHRPRQNDSWSEAVVDRVLDRAKRSVWTIGTQPMSWTVCKACLKVYDRAQEVCECGAKEWQGHYAAFPEALARTCLKASTPKGGGFVVLDPFSGSGTSGVVALALHCSYIGIELSPAYAALSRARIARAELPMFGITEAADLGWLEEASR